ncbi:MAG: hypothetical protein DRQ01_00655 [Ignavibacteriae bacterium]|nr:MAG: hypothetical protein DRQ01_00655 [Ignavibacteriota bacterium]
MQTKILSIIFICFFIILVSCDSEHGIAPKRYVAETTGFGGNIVFYGVWPDSIKRTHIVMFKDPLLTSLNFNILNLKYLSLEIPFGVGYYNYSSADTFLFPFDGIIEAGEYAYLAVAQQSTEELSFERKDWFVTGVYYANGDTTTPGILTIPANTMVRDINIICDFDNPPPQPPGGN